MRTPQAKPEVGRTYLCPDGIVRWVYARGPSGVFYTRWRDDTDPAGPRWFRGGSYCAGRTPWDDDAVEVAGPRPGDTVTVMGVFGTADQYTLTEMSRLTIAGVGE